MSDTDTRADRMRIEALRLALEFYGDGNPEAIAAAAKVFFRYLMEQD